MRKTKVCVGERFSIFTNTAGRDCIKDNLGETNRIKPSEYILVLGRHGKNETNTSLALENIKSIPQNSIGCNFSEVVFTDTVLANILPRLKFHRNCTMHCLTLSATKNEHVAGILAQDQKIRIGGTRQTIELKGHAVAVLLKLEVQEYDLLILTADEEEHVAPILALEQMVSLRRTKKMELRDYAANLLPKLEILEGTVLEELTLGAKKNEHVARILAQELKIPIGGIQKIELRDYAVVVLLKLKIQEGGMLEALILAAENREHVTPVLEQRQMVSVGGIQKMELSNYAVCILPKLEVREGGELEELVLGAWRKEHITEILSMEDESINVWDVAVVISGGCQREIHKKLKGTNIAIMPVE